MQITGVGIWEDPTHPESWLRDATLDYWNPATQAWVTGPALLSDAATHSHTINPPIQTARVRITLPNISPINPRLGEVVLEGSLLGCSQADVVAGNNTCTLFDENTFPFQAFGDNRLEGGGWNFQYSDAYSGAMCLVKTDTNLVYAEWDNSGPFTYQIPDWNMAITQTPQNANEYRYLQFAWKAVDPAVTGITLELGAVNHGNINSLASLYCGTWNGLTMWPNPSNIKEQISTTVPTSWQLVTVDLWQLFQSSVSPPNITFIDFGSIGGSGK